MPSPRTSRNTPWQVIKTLAPNARGAKALSARFGDELICIRHRMDPTGRQRLTTVELVVETRPIRQRASPMVEVKIGHLDRALRDQLMAANARWDTAGQTWQLRRATAVALGLKHRIIQK